MRKEIKEAWRQVNPTGRQLDDLEAFEEGYRWGEDAMEPKLVEQIKRAERFRDALLKIKTMSIPGEYAYLVASDALAETTEKGEADE